MSMYMQFFLRAGDSFYPIGTYNRSTAVYEIFHEVVGDVWEQITPVTDSVLNEVNHKVHENINDFKKAIEKISWQIDTVIRMTDTSLEERMELCDEYRTDIEGYEKRIRELEGVESFAYLLDDMLDEAEGTKYSDKIETIDRNEYIYVGIEVGIPTLEDMKGNINE